MQRFGTVSTWGYLEQLEQMHRRLPPLQDIFARWQHAGRSSRSHALAQRELVLGVATLSGVSLRLLYDLASPYIKDPPERIYWHAPTHSAAETQTVLPPQVLVQKTVSLEMTGRLLLWTSVGEQAHTLEQRRSVAESLGLPRRAAKQCSTNPATCRPEEEFGMLPGMVSPFLPPFHPTRLEAVVHVTWPTDWEEQEKAVGVSLSLFESLILPLHCFGTILRQYAARAYEPRLRWIELCHHHRLPLEREQAA